MATTFPEVFFDGHPRKLALNPSPPTFSGLPKFGVVAPRVVDPADYVEVDNRKYFPWIYDQNGYSSCTGNGLAGLLRAIRAMAGMEDADLSAAFIYSCINGGRDEGSSISDGAVSIQTTGTCLTSEVPENEIYTSQIPKSAYQTAKRFRAGPTFHCQTYEQMLSTVMLRGGVALGFTAGNQTPNLDRYGVTPVIHGQPNHCVFAIGTKHLPTGEWALDCKMPWGPKFGDHGWFYLTHAHFPVMANADACGLFTALDDPQGHNPPVAA